MGSLSTLITLPDTAYMARPYENLKAQSKKMRIAGTVSNDYPGYDKVIAQLDRETFETQVASGAAWIGTPVDVLLPVETQQSKYFVDHVIDITDK